MTQGLPPGAGRRRRRRPWALPLLLLLLVLVPLTEIFVLLQVGNWIGLLPTIGLLIVVAVFGTWLSRREGSKAWKGLNQALATGELPGGQIADAAMILIGALLLVFPGFLTDLVALLFLLPFTRPLMKRLFAWAIADQAKKFTDSMPGMMPPIGMPMPGMPGYPPTADGPASHSADGRMRNAGAYGEVIEGEVVEGDVVEGEEPDRG